MTLRFHQLSKVTREKIYLGGLGLALLLVIAFLPNYEAIVDRQSGDIKSEDTRIQAIFKKERGELAEKVHVIASSEDLKTAMAENDSAKTLVALQEEGARSGVAILRATDPAGVVLASYPSLKEHGNNLFVSTDWAERLLHGPSSAVFGKGTMNALIMVAGQPLGDAGNSRGAIFGGYPTNDDYARKVRNAYFESGTNLAFYTPTDGVVGTTYANRETIKLLNSYLGVNPDGSRDALLAKTPTEQNAKIEGRYVHIHVIPFGDWALDNQGIVYVTPSPHQSNAIVFVAIFTLFFFVLETWIHHITLGHAWGSKHFVVLVFFACLFFFFGFLIALYRTRTNFPDLKPSPYLIYNSTMNFSPAFGVFDKRFDQRVAIQINTGSESINSAEAVVTYDPMRVAIADIVTTSSFCDPSFFIEKSIDPKKGVVRIACIVPSPGFSGANGTVAELVVQPLLEGPFTLKFGEETRVLANDGLGTDVLRLAQDSAYQVADQDPLTENEMLIFSPSHRNGERWYRSRNVRVNWLHAAEDDEYLYAIDQTPGDMPLDATTTTARNAQVAVPHDGIYYFHVRSIHGGVAGKIFDYRIKIDSEPPSTPNILASSLNVRQGDVVRLTFTSADTLSGLQNTFYVKIGDDLLLPTESPLYIPMMKKGAIPITVRAFDRARNTSESSIVVHIN